MFAIQLKLYSGRQCNNMSPDLWSKDQVCPRTRCCFSGKLTISVSDSASVSDDQQISERGLGLI